MNEQEKKALQKQLVADLGLWAASIAWKRIEPFIEDLNRRVHDAWEQGFRASIADAEGHELKFPRLQTVE